MIYKNNLYAKIIKKSYTSEFKAKVALEAIKGDQTIGYNHYRHLFVHNHCKLHCHNPVFSISISIKKYMYKNLY